MSSKENIELDSIDRLGSRINFFKKGSYDFKTGKLSKDVCVKRCTLIFGIIVVIIIAVAVSLGAYYGLIRNNNNDDFKVPTTSGATTATATTTTTTTTSTTPTSSPSTTAPTTSGTATATAATTTTTTPTQTTPTSSPSTTGWTIWGAWTACTATCGSGIRKRYRTCLESSSTCIGDYIEQQVCSQANCPGYGKWDSWSSWGSCDVTCGGGRQTRGRACTTTSGIGCVGEEQQQQVCSDWHCPDCTKTCLFGTLNRECDTCVFESMNISGRILSSASGTGIMFAVIYDISAPTRMLTETNSTGFFTLKTTCTTSVLLISKEGFLDSTANVTGEDMLITMTLIVLPHFVETPQSKYRLTGDDVMFCCLAKGRPDILYYEWLKNSILLDSNLYPNGSHLYLTNIEVGDIGQYACRANSKVGAAISTAASLKVKEKPEHFCSDALQEKTTTLPDDCVQPETNKTTYEVGECIAKRCRQDGVNEKSSCRDNDKSCCGTYEAELKTVTCTGYDLIVVVVKSCHCTSCSYNSLEISGSALAVGTDAPLRFGEVRVNGEIMGSTSNTGTFSFSVTQFTAKIIINIRDIYFNQFLEATKVLHISDDTNGQIQVDIRVFEAAKSVKFLPDVEKTLVAGGNVANTSEATVEISVPANSFYDLNGSPYTGTVSSTLTFLDPTDTTYGSNIPGEFNFMNDEGEETNLGSIGVFNLAFHGDSGNELALNEPLDIYIPLKIGENGTTEEFKLWKLSTESGSWEIVPATTSSRRRKRYVSKTKNWMGEIEQTVSSSAWYNIDRIDWSNQNKCYFKLRFYKDSTLTEPILNHYRSLRLEYHMIENTIFSTYWDRILNNEECMEATCKHLDGYISVFSSGKTGIKPLYAAVPIPHNTTHVIGVDNKTLIITFSNSSDGPFYNDKGVCDTSSKKMSHLQYHYGETTDFSRKTNPDLSFNFSRTLNLTENEELSSLLYYPEDGGARSTCKVKVKVIFDLNIPNLNEHVVKIRVTSKGGNFTIIKGKVLGILERTITNYTNIECLEYKCSGKVNTYFEEDHEDHRDVTQVTVAIISRTIDIKCSITNESSSLIREGDQVSQLNRNTFTFLAPVNYGPTYGIYSDSTDKGAIDEALDRTESKCITSHFKTNPIDPNGIAVKFICTK